MYDYEKVPQGEPTEVSYSGRKADGTHVQKRSLGPLAKGEWSRHIRFLDGTSIQLVDVLHIKMTSRVENPRFIAAMKRSLNEQSGTCNLNNRGTVISTGVIFDQFVEQIESVIGKGEYKLTISKAPSLGCEGLAYESFWRQPDGSYKLVRKGVPVSLDLVEPEAELFDVGSNYKDVGSNYKEVT